MLSGHSCPALTPERCLPSVNWVKVLEHSIIPPHPRLAIYVWVVLLLFLFLLFFFQFGLEGQRILVVLF